jgi:hypothetical protein
MLDDFIFGMHAAIVLLGLIIPFIKNKKLWTLYSLIIPFLFFHWAINDDTCFLTQLECHVTNKPKERTFMGRLVGPIYNLSDNEIGKLIKSILFTLWFLVQFRLGHFSFNM